MSVEQYGNLGVSLSTATISAATNPATIFLTAGDGALFPSTANGPFRIVVANADRTNAEVMIVTARSTDTLTAYRGTAISTYGAADTPVPTLTTHSAGSVLVHSVTAGAVLQLLSERQAAFTPPTGFTLHDGAGGAAMTADLYGFTLNLPSSSTNNIIYCSTAISSATYTAEFGFRGAFHGGASAQVGVVIGDGTKVVTLRFRQDVPNWDLFQWSAYNTPDSSAASGSFIALGQPGYIIRIIADATHRTWYIGDYRRRAFYQIAQQSALAYLTETQVGFFGLSNNSVNCLCEAFHFSLS